MRKLGFNALVATVVVLTGCAGASNMDGFWCDLCGTPTTYVQASLPARELPAFPRNCLVGDYEVSGEQACLQYSGGCYQLDTGNWCTAGSLLQCPEGTEAIAIEVDCPDGDKCWMYSPTLRCHSAGA